MSTLPLTRMGTNLFREGRRGEERGQRGQRGQRREKQKG
tara:strand:+ start:168 stop:284 length:117 start_codon:yes stop_codon:yes gene_type:complete